MMCVYFLYFNTIVLNDTAPDCSEAKAAEFRVCVVV